MYKTFYNNGEIEIYGQNEHINARENDYEDYNYLLNRTWYKTQQIIKAKPETAKKKSTAAPTMRRSSLRNHRRFRI